MKTKLFILIWLQVSVALVQAQGFVNLDFEQANNPGSFYASNTIPGWTAYIGGVAQTYVGYNSVSLGAASVNLQGTNSGFTPIQGEYFVLLQGSSFSFGGLSSASIGQTGLIPPSALSLIFWGGFGSTNVSFNGQLLLVNKTGTIGSYGIYTADISAYAGQVGELLFTAYGRPSTPAEWIYLDNIQFSTTPVPEPGVWSLLGLSCLLVGGWRWKNARLSKLGLPRGRC